MKVMCIQPKGSKPVRKGLNDNAEIIVGEIYTVIKEGKYQEQDFREKCSLHYQTSMKLN